MARPTANPPPTVTVVQAPGVRSHGANYYGQTPAGTEPGRYPPLIFQSPPTVPQAQYGTMPVQFQPPPPEPLFVAVNPFDAPSPRWRRPARPTPLNPAIDADTPPEWPTQPIPVQPPGYPAGYPVQGPYWGRPGTLGWGAPPQPTTFYGQPPTVVPARPRSRDSYRIPVRRGRSPARRSTRSPTSRRSPARYYSPQPIMISARPQSRSRSRSPRQPAIIVAARPRSRDSSRIPFRRGGSPARRLTHSPARYYSPPPIIISARPRSRSRSSSRRSRSPTRRSRFTTRRSRSPPARYTPPPIIISARPQSRSRSSSRGSRSPRRHSRFPTRRSRSPPARYYIPPPIIISARPRSRSRSSSRRSHSPRRSGHSRSRSPRHSHPTHRTRSPSPHAAQAEKSSARYSHSLSSGSSRHSHPTHRTRSPSLYAAREERPPAEVEHAEEHSQPHSGVSPGHSPTPHPQSSPEIASEPLAESVLSASRRSRQYSRSRRSSRSFRRTSSSRAHSLPLPHIIGLSPQTPQWYMHRPHPMTSTPFSPGIRPISVMQTTVPILGVQPTLPLPNTSSSRHRHRKSSIAIQTVLFTVAFFLFDFIPRQVYLYFLLRIPSLYFSRVTRIFEDARLSLPDIKRMARAKADQWNTTNPPPFPSIVTPDQMPLPQTLLHFRASWEGFIDSLMREWKTLNIVSVLLMSAILTMLQIDAASHPITRTSALFSLICALMSLLYGCMYIVRFGGMRKMHKASSFADEAQKGTTSIWWNVWVLLAMPAVWLAWSIIMFFTCIMSFIWLSGSSQDTTDFAISPRVLLGLRIALTVVFALGIIYFGLIVRTFHRYGDPLDREWMRRVNEWTKEAASVTPYWNQPDTKPPYPRSPILVRVPSSPYSRGAPRGASPTHVPLPPPFPDEFRRLPPSRPLTTHPSGFFHAGGRLFLPAEPVTIMQLGDPDVHAPQIVDKDLQRFMLEVSSAWKGQLALTPPDGAAGTDLPSYTSLSPADSDGPASSAREPVHYPPKSRSLDGSKISSKSSSLGRPQTSTFMSAESPTAAFAALGTAHAQRWLAMNSPPSRAPSPDPDPEKALPPVPPARSPMQNVQEFLDLWNQRYFHSRNLEAFMVPRVGPSGAAEFAVNLVSRPWPYRPSADPGPTILMRTRSNTKASSDESEPRPSDRPTLGSRRSPPRYSRPEI